MLSYFITVPYIAFEKQDTFMKVCCDVRREYRDVLDVSQGLIIPDVHKAPISKELPPLSHHLC